MSSDKKTLLRSLPSVDQLLQHEASERLVNHYGRSLTIDAIRNLLEQTRQTILQHDTLPNTTPDHLLSQTETRLAEQLAPTLQPVINATGVIVHTNLGRAPLSEAALAAVRAVGEGYSTLEYDISTGQRGSRTNHPDSVLQTLLGCEASLVVNNNAAAVLLMLTALCRGKEVIISRGQLVEIGGGFRIPDVMAQSGAKLVEVGTTNRTHLVDFERAINENTGALLVAHHSNYKIIGFTSQPALDELARLAKRRGVPLLYDQGSGGIMDTRPFGIPPELTVQEGVAQGCDLVAFSGDKLLGGPQAGILCGRADLIQTIKKHPLARAVRADKFCLAALTTTLTHFIKDEALSHVPVWQMLAKPASECRETAEAWQQQLVEQGVSCLVVAGESTVGGGSLPGTSIDTFLLAVETDEPDALAKRLRAEPVPVIARIENGRLLFDPRTVLPKSVEILLKSIVHCSLLSHS